MLNLDGSIKRPPEENQLVRKAKAGDAKAFIQLYDAYVEYVYLYILSLVSNNKLAEGLTFQVFFKAWGQLSSYKPLKLSLLSWFVSIAQSHVRNHQITSPNKTIEEFGIESKVQNLDASRKYREARVWRLSSSFRSYTRDALLHHIYLHPRQQQSWLGAMPYYQRAFIVFIVFMVASFTTGTVRAQSALPGDSLYNWKIASEEAWAVLSLDPVATNITLTNRRINEWIAVANDPARSYIAMRKYIEAVARLKSFESIESLVRILPAIESQHAMLDNAGLITPEVEGFLAVTIESISAQTISFITPTATATVTATKFVPTRTPTDLPTATSTKVPTFTPTNVPTSTPVPTLTPTDVPTATPTDIPTFTPTPTDVPTDVPTETPTEAPTGIPTDTPEPASTPTVEPEIP